MDNFASRISALLSALLPHSSITRLAEREFCIRHLQPKHSARSGYPRDLVVIVDEDLVSRIELADANEFERDMAPELLHTLVHDLADYNPWSQNFSTFLVALNRPPSLH
ncbi:hypothetical protein [Paraburkholderia sp.]|uniref:hypothetical protein n=1 Tax=Paraburkholderia sp. TaxID=1926495 RepID=UPI00238E904B|nr:hypothetical protein [Paraburkholderia sp.]MDE1182528.1 hypothetical protein [Paraburkholderia sp.]